MAFRCIAAGPCSTPTCWVSTTSCAAWRARWPNSLRKARRSTADGNFESEDPIMTEAVIVSTARTGLAKSWRGAFNMTHGATLGSHAVKAAMERAKLDPGEVEDVIMGCANPEGATGMNIARQIAIAAGCPVTVPGMTVNRFCSSGLQTIALAAPRGLAGGGRTPGARAGLIISRV